jgi:hypothetical protein
MLGYGPPAAEDQARSAAEASWEDMGRRGRRSVERCILRLFVRVRQRVCSERNRRRVTSLLFFAVVRKWKGVRGKIAAVERVDGILEQDTARAKPRVSTHIGVQ